MKLASQASVIGLAESSLKIMRQTSTLSLMISELVIGCKLMNTFCNVVSGYLQAQAAL